MKKLIDISRIKHKGIFIILIFIATLAAHGRGIDNTFIWDDDVYVQNNLYLRSFEGLKEIWTDIDAEPQYYPMTHTSFWIEYHLWQLRPLGYHLDNILLHGLNACLLWLLLSSLGIPFAFWVALLFAIHPVTVESVAWITERKNVLSATFYLLAFLSYLSFIRKKNILTDAPAENSEKQLSQDPNKHGNILYLLALTLFLFALLSKTVTCSFPVIILLLIWWKNGKIRIREVLYLLPFFAIGLILGLTTAWIEKYHLGAIGDEWVLSPMGRILVAGRALWFYFFKLIWPHPLAFFYERWHIDPSQWWQYLFPLCCIAVFLLLWFLRRRWGRGPLTGVLMFSVTLFPALGFFNVYPHRFSFVADHFQYLASIPMLVVLCSLFYYTLRKANKATVKIAGFFMAVIFASLIFISSKQTAIYKDLPTLWQDTVTKTPSSWAAHNNLGIQAEKQGNLETALESYKRTLELWPIFDFGHFNIARVYLKQGKSDLALIHFLEVLRIDTDYSMMHPKSRPSIKTDASQNIGYIYEKKGNLEKAAYYYIKAIEFNEQNFLAFNALGNIYRKTGNIQKAKKSYLKATTIQPAYIKPYFGLGLIFLQEMDYLNALNCFAKILEIDPNNSSAREKYQLAKERIQRKQHNDASNSEYQ